MPVLLHTRNTLPTVIIGFTKTDPLCFDVQVRSLQATVTSLSADKEKLLGVLGSTSSSAPPVAGQPGRGITSAGAAPGVDDKPAAVMQYDRDRCDADDVSQDFAVSSRSKISSVRRSRECGDIGVGIGIDGGHDDASLNNGFVKVTISGDALGKDTALSNSRTGTVGCGNRPGKDGPQRDPAGYCGAGREDHQTRKAEGIRPGEGADDDYEEESLAPRGGPPPVPSAMSPRAQEFGRLARGSMEATALLR